MAICPPSPVSPLQPLPSIVNEFNSQIQNVYNYFSSPTNIFDLISIGCTSFTTTTIGAASEGSESASATTWAQTDGTNVEVWISSRVGYFHAGDKKLYSYMRLFTYNCFGLLLSISAETRVEVDATEAC